MFDGKITVSLLRRALHRYNVTLSGNNWDLENARGVYFGVTQVASGLGEASGQSSVNAFTQAFNKVDVTIEPITWMAEAGYNSTGGHIEIRPGVTITPRQMAHELGHVFEKHIYFDNGSVYAGTNNPVQMIASQGIYDSFGNLMTIGGNRNNGVAAPDNGYCSDSWQDECQWHPVSLVDGQTPQEDWADIFMNWSFDSFYE